MHLLLQQRIFVLPYSSLSLSGSGLSLSPRVQDVDSRMFPAALERIVPLGNEQRPLL